MPLLSQNDERRATPRIRASGSSVQSSVCKGHTSALVNRKLQRVRWQWHVNPAKHGNAQAVNQCQEMYIADTAAISQRSPGSLVTRHTTVIMELRAHAQTMVAVMILQ